MSADLKDLTEEYAVNTPRQTTCKIFVTPQLGGVWIAYVMYFDNELLTRGARADTEREGAYIKAVEWVQNNIDDQAVIEPLI